MSKRISVTLDDSELEQLESLAKARGISKSKILEESLYIDSGKEAVKQDIPKEDDNPKTSLLRDIADKQRRGEKEAHKLRDHKRVETNDLYLAEALTTHYDFECLEVKSPRPEKGIYHKSWILAKTVVTEI